MTFLINNSEYGKSRKKLGVYASYAIALTNIPHKTNLTQNLKDLAKKLLT